MPWAALTASSLHQGRDVPVLNDYRDVVGGVLRRLYTLNTADLQHIFPDSKPLDLKLL